MWSRAAIQASGIVVCERNSQASSTFGGSPFRLDETPALVQVAELGPDREAVQGLAPGSFPAWNRTSRGRLTGKVF